MNKDSRLLRQFVQEGSDDAFAELVERHLDLVYSVAFRVTGGRSGLAEDVAQQVFIDLAQKARTLPADTVPAAWLHRATRLAALAAARSEGRRNIREQYAAMPSETDSSMNLPDWQELAPVLDEALDELAAKDREVLLLRFFQQQPFGEMGKSLGLAEDAARMRVARALDRLRELLARRGVTSSATALAALLGEQAVISAPAGMVLEVSSVALAHLSTTGTSTLLGLMKSKLLIASAMVAISITPWWWMHSANLRLESDLARMRAEREHRSGENPAPVVAPQDSEEHRELLRLRGEVGALRRSLMAALAASREAPAAPASGRTPGEHFIQKISGRAMSLTGEDLGPIEDRFLDATHLGRFLRLDMLHDSGADSATNVVETALWSALNGQLSKFTSIYHVDNETASEGERDRFLRQQMDLLAVNLEKSTALEFRSMHFDDEQNVWSVLVGLDPGPPGSRLGTHFNFQVRDDGRRWQVVGFSAGDALPSRVP